MTTWSRIWRVPVGITLAALGIVLLWLSDKTGWIR